MYGVKPTVSGKPPFNKQVCGPEPKHVSPCVSSDSLISQGLCYPIRSATIRTCANKMMTRFDQEGSAELFVAFLVGFGPPFETVVVGGSSMVQPC